MDDSTPKITPNFQTQPRRILVFIIEWMIVNFNSTWWSWCQPIKLQDSWLRASQDAT